MKSMNDSNTDDDGNNHNWLLGFSLSPHMKMEATTSSGPPHPSHHHEDHHHHDHHYYHHPMPYSAAPSNSSSVVPSNFYLSPSHLNPSGICSYGVGENNSAFHSGLAMMPLKSDGSLCIMEALTRSQTQGRSLFPPFIFIHNNLLFMHSKLFLILQLFIVYYSFFQYGPI